MSARAKVAAPDAVIDAMKMAVDTAEVGASWANDRILPMISALLALADFSDDDSSKSNQRLELIQGVAAETRILVGDMAGYFENETRNLQALVEQLKGGAA